MNAFISRFARKLPVALWLLFQIPAMAADVGFVAVMKGQEFAQTSEDIVSLGEWRTWYDTGEVQNEGEQGEPPYVFQTLAFGMAPDSLVSGSVTVPGGAVLNLQREVAEAVSTEIRIENGYNSPLDMNTARPDGSYTVQLVTQNDGAYSTALALTGGAYPPVPHVTNFTALQSADAASAITVQWAGMAGTAQDFILCQVIQLGGGNDGMVLWQSGMPGTPGALDGTATQAEIPAGTLNSGSDYQAEVTFVKTTQVQSTPALAIAGYYKLTGLRIRTAALPGTALGSTLLRSTPQNGWSWVPVDAAVAFHFSQPMSPAHISIGWTKDGGPLSTGTFSYHWTQANTVLLCEFSSNLPPDSEIGWTLNLAGFRDAAGSALSGSPNGSFRTGMNGPESPPDVGFIGIIKTRSFRQSDATPVADGRYEASVEVEAAAPNRLKAAAITALSNGRSGPLYADPWDGDEYEAPGEYGSKADLDRFYPNGDYRFDLDGLGDGAQSVTVSLGTPDQYPAAPTITNLAALQAVDPAAPVTVSWNALSGWNNDMATLGPGDGLIEFEILDSCDREVFWVEGTEMTDGVSCVIPAGTLQPGRSYRANLIFIRITDMDFESYPDALAVAAFESETAFTIQTTGQPEMPAIALQRIGLTTRITATGGEPEATYTLETSSDLNRWTLLDTYWNQQEYSIHQFDDTDAQHFKSRFYRVAGPHCESPMMPPISIQGTVWTNNSHTTPLAAAVVGTSLDGRTTTTDAQGRFFLITDTRSLGGTAEYIITVHSGALTKNFGPWTWGDQPRGQVFEME